MAMAVDWPAEVLAAAVLKLNTPVGGILWAPEIDYPCLVGRVYMDLSGRFTNGRLIRTSQIMRFTDEDGWTIAHTFSGSHYLLVLFAGKAFSGLERLRLTCSEISSNLH